VPPLDDEVEPSPAPGPEPEPEPEPQAETTADREATRTSGATVRRSRTGPI
jgi:hypothetical protein